MSNTEQRPAKRPRIRIEAIPRGWPGTLATVAHVGALIADGAKDFDVRQHAIAVLRERGVRPKDYAGEIKALFEWVQSQVRYTRDPSRVETLHSARRMLQLRAGDCDDMSIVLGALLESVGHPVRLVLTGTDPGRPTRFTHIYVEAWCRDRWIPLDPTMPYPMGWQPRTAVRRVIELHGGGAPMQGAAEEREASSRSLADGVGLYQRVNRFAPARVVRAGGRRRMPPVVVELGRLVGLMYRSDKWQRGRPRTFIHFMRDRPRLVCDAGGTQLYIVGGSYRVTAHGIEG